MKWGSADLKRRISAFLSIILGRGDELKGQFRKSSRGEEHPVAGESETWLRKLSMTPE